MLKQLIFSVALFVVSVCFALTVRYLETRTEEASLALIDLKNIQQVDLKTPERLLSFSFKKGVWQLGEGEAHQERVKAFVDIFRSSASVYKSFKVPAAAAQRYQLDKPGVTVQFHGNSGAKQTVSFGETLGGEQRDPDDSQGSLVYAKSSAFPGVVFLAHPSLLRQAMKPVFYFENKEIWKTQRLGLRRLQIFSAEQLPVTLVRETSGWFLEGKGRRFKADRQIFDSYVGKLLSWSAQAKFSSDGLDLASLRFMGAIALGQSPQAMEKVRIYDYNKVILVEKNNLFYQVPLKNRGKELFPSFEFFLNRNIFDGVSLEKASRFIHSGITFSKAGSQWFREQENSGERASHSDTGSHLLSRLDEKRLSDFLEKLSALRARATYVLGGPQSLVKLGFKPNFPHFIVHIDDRKSVLKIYLSDQSNYGNDGYIWLEGEDVVYGLKEDKQGLVSSFLQHMQRE